MNKGLRFHFGFTPTPEPKLGLAGENQVGRIRGLPPHQNRAVRFVRLGRMRDLTRGFTMIEIVIMLAIIVMLATIVLANFPAFNESGALLSGAQTLALDLRSMQNISLTVARVQLKNGKFYDGTSSGDSDVTKAKSPKAIGIHFDKSSDNRKTYLEFVDVPPINHQYDGSAIDADVARVDFFRGIYVNRIYIDGACGVKDFPTADIIFDSPDAAMTFIGDGANITGSCPFLKIELKSPTLNLTRTVTIRITGQISNQ